MSGFKARTDTSVLDSVEPMDVDEECEDVAEENEDKEFEKLLWSIDDDTLFHPLGLTNHGTDAGKTVFVTWNEEYLLNFVFKRSKRSKKISLTKVRLPMPNGEIVNDMFILEMNALLLMRSGNVYYFSSVKSMHAVDWLNDAGGGVRCMALAPPIGFSCIRYVAAEKALMLEMYQDVPDIGRNAPALLLRCDVTFDDTNLFNCAWEDERYTLVTQQVTADNLNFLHCLLMEEVELEVGQWLHIFTVSSNVFALIAATNERNAVDNDNNTSVDYHIQLLCTYATNVDSVQLDCAERRCLIFLQCGTIDIWYYSQLICGLRRMQHYTGSQYRHQVYAASTRCFYFTDEEQVAQLHFSYDEQTDSCRVQEHYKVIPGMVACTWVETQRMLVCLSCNNIFYKISFERTASASRSDLCASFSDAVTTEYENFQRLYELTPARLKRLLARAELVDELTQMPLQMHAAVEQECVKQQLLGVASNRHLYRYLAKARLVYSVQLPTAMQQDVIVMYANNNYQLHHDSYVALIYMQISRNDVLHDGDSLWHLYIDVDCSDSYMLHIPNTLLKQQLCIVIPLKRSENQLLAELVLRLYTLVCLESDFVAVSLPIDLEINAATYAELFTCYKRCVTICNNYDIQKLIENFLNQKQKKEIKTTEMDAEKSSTAEVAHMLKHTLHLPATCPFSAVAKCLHVQKREAQSFECYFMSTAIKITHMPEGNYIILESADAVALCYLKLHLLNSMPELLEKCNEAAAKDRQQTLNQLQCDLTCCTNALLQAHTLDESTASQDSDTVSHAMQLQQLKNIYSKLRQDFHKLYS
uniref:5-hydroxytryptamine receptor 2B n=1 Tax=Zeugodacus cucurbitae TaxID=28588 RepID=A0A0A1WTL2_ZEUCU